jgi:uncharacterized protein YjbI with pentapeptide repeats
VVVSAAAAVVISVGLTVWLLSIAGRNPSLRIEAIQIGLTLGAGVSGGLALVLAFRRQWLSERAQAGTEDDATQRRITELYTKAVEELGHDKAPVRLGGLYALERLAQDQSVHRQTVVDIICAYLRMPFQPPADAVPGPSGTTADPSLDGPPVPQPIDVRLQNGGRQELQVRITAQRLLESHLTVPDDNAIGLSNERHWPGIRIDLAGAVLVGFRFYRCCADYADFRGARFTGDTTFTGARFSNWAGFSGAEFSGPASFDEVQFGAEARLVGAELEKTKFGRVKFSGPAEDDDEDEESTAKVAVAEFEGTKFGGDAKFDRAQFHGVAWFSEAEFGVAALFLEAQFNGSAWFDRAQFYDVAFSHAKFCREAHFFGAKFTRGGWFDEAQFTHAAWFDATRFAGPAVFDRAQFGGRAQFGAGASWTGRKPSGAALFGEKASFIGAKFTGRASFQEVLFGGDALFGKAHFSEPPSFKEARACYAYQHVWPSGWHIEPQSSQSATAGRLTSDVAPPAPSAASVKG